MDLRMKQFLVASFSSKQMSYLDLLVRLALMLGSITHKFYSDIRPEDLSRFTFIPERDFEEMKIKWSDSLLLQKAEVSQAEFVFGRLEVVILFAILFSEKLILGLFTNWKL